MHCTCGHGARGKKKFVNISEGENVESQTFLLFKQNILLENLEQILHPNVSLCECNERHEDVSSQKNYIQLTRL